MGRVALREGQANPGVAGKAPGSVGINKRGLRFAPSLATLNGPWFVSNFGG